MLFSRNLITACRSSDLPSWCALDDPNWLEAELELADIIVTATGARHVIGLHNIASVKDGSIILNVGHARDEIDVEGLYSTFSHSPVLKHLDRVIIDEERLKQSPRDGEGVHNQGRRVYLLAKGSMVNLIAAAGDSLNAFDVTLATMVAGIDFMARNSFGEHQEYSAGLHLLPADVCSRVAKEHLRLSSRTGNRL